MSGRTRFLNAQFPYYRDGEDKMLKQEMAAWHACYSGIHVNICM